MLLVTGTTLERALAHGRDHVHRRCLGEFNSARSPLRGKYSQQGASALEAAIQAGRTRIRPVLMTAAAMVAGMIPMAIGAPGEGRKLRSWHGR